MKHILQVLQFEYLTCVKNKAFIITTIIFMASILLLGFIPAIIMIFTGDTSSDGKETPVIAVVSNRYYDDKTLADEFQNIYEDYEIKITNENMDAIKKNVNNETYEFAVVIDDKLSYTFVTKNNSLINTETKLPLINGIIQDMYRMDSFEKFGISSKDTKEILSADISSTTIATGKDQTKNYISTYVMIMLLYIAILMYGHMVSQSIVAEKNTRAMEMLITCAKPAHLMFGKVIGSGLAGLTQLVLILGSTFASMSALSTQTLPPELQEMISFPIQTVIYAIIFFLLGYFIFSFLFGALSSFATRSEDINTLTTPVMLIYIATFIIVIFSINFGSVDTPLMVVCSYIPFTAPMCMLVRATMSDVALYEILISIAIQVITIYLLGILAATIYRIGVLMYGKPPKMGEIIKLLIEDHKTNKK